MANSMNNSAIYLLPGMQAKLLVPGYFIAHGERKFLDDSGTYVSKALIQGFAVQYDDVGTIVAVENEPAVIYTHNKFGLNKVYFFAMTGEVSFIDIIAVPIHDHSSIVSGGPAFSTFFTDDETVE